MKLYLLLLLGLVIIISGCIGQQNRNPNNGIVINEFSVDPKVAEYGDTVRFFIDGENIGGTTADCVTTELFGLEGGWTRSNIENGNIYDVAYKMFSASPTIFFGKGFAFGISIVNGKFGGGFFEYSNPEGRNIRIDVIKNQGWSLSVNVQNSFIEFANNYCNSLIDDPTIKLEHSLSPPLSERNKPGQAFIAEWVLKPPLLAEGLKVDYPVTSRTSFFYKSNAQVNIQAFSKAEFRRREKIGDRTEFPLNVINTHAAPIQVSIKRGASPIIVDTDTAFTSAETFNYLIELSNSGDGYPLPFTRYDDTRGLGPGVESGFVMGTMTVAGPGVYFEDCLGQGGTDVREIMIAPNVVQGALKLRADGKAPFGCKIVIDKSVWQTNPVGTISLTFNIFYRYYVDKQTSVTVVGPTRS
ncbi:MAG: hypothetical protein QMD85_05300 [Candidatus Aenigmarchaeota archaeon]|nr:hypothetical protein [Candidatus Aenigmarchaeota archaeon]